VNWYPRPAIVRIRSRSAANALRSAEIWACRLFSSTIRSGQTRFISVFLSTTAPDASISAINTSNARPPSSNGWPSARTSRRRGKTLKRPNSIAAGVSAGSIIGNSRVRNGKSNS
jgi:hypothetical protein